MRKTNIRKKLAVILSAAMVFTMAAPATPAHAAAGDINFDFTELNPSVGTQFNFNISRGTAPAGTGVIPTTNGVAPNPAPGANMFLVNGSGSIYMPYWNGAAFYDKNNSTEVASFGTFNGNAFPLLNGYKISGWYRNKASVYNNSKMNYMDESTYPYGESRYIAQLISDGALFGYKETHAPAVAGTVAPAEINGAATAPATVTASYPALRVVQAAAKNIPGFKLDAASTTSKVGTTDTTNGAHLFTGDTGTNFKVTGDQVNGTMINQPVEINFKYAVDPAQKFGIKVIHNLNGAPVTDRTLREFAVGTDLATVTDKIMPDHALIEAQTGEPSSRYRLASTNPVVITNASGAAFTPNSSLLGPNDAPNVADQIQANVLPALPNGDTDPNPANGLLTGKMINQGMTVTYNYVPNPNYYMTLSVRYEDTNGLDLTDQVAAKVSAAGNMAANVNASTATQPALVTSSSTGSRLVYKVVTPAPPGGQNYTVYAPFIDGYSTNAGDEPSLSPADGTQYANSNFASLPATGWSTTNQFYTVNTGAAPNGSAEIIVTYKPDAANLVQTNFATDLGGDLEVNGAPFDPSSNPAHAVTFVKQNKNPVLNTYDVSLTAAQLPTPKADDGYKFTGWQLDKNDGSTPAGFQDITLPTTFTARDMASSIVKFKAKFAVDPDQWSTINFTIGDTAIHDDGISTSLQLVNRAGGNPRPLTWNIQDIADNIANVSLDPSVTGKVIKWFDSNNQEMTATSTVVNGGTYTAYAVSSTSGTLHTPDVRGAVDPVSGEPSVNVNTSTTPIDSALDYVVTDANGNVVLKVAGSSLLPAGKIKGPGINPGYPYIVHTVQPNTPGINVGSPLPTDPSNISPGSATTIVPATANPPAVGEDPNFPGRRTITVTPVSPDTEYKLVDAAGNEVSPYVSPSSGKVVFEDLDPNATYIVVPRRTGDTLTAPPDTNGTPVNTGTLTPVILPRNVNLLLPAGVSASVIKIGGLTKSAGDLNGILPDTLVEITVPTLNGTKLFTGSFIVAGIPAPAAGNSITFQMPNNDVTVQALYTAAGVAWDSSTPPTGTTTNPVVYEGSATRDNIAVGVPDIDVPGTYRLRIVRDTNVPSDIKDFIQSQEDDIPYTGLWQARVIVEVWNTVSMAWEPYAGSVDALKATFTTGSLTQGSREYRLYESVASASNATRMSGQYETDWTLPTYTGSFQTDVTNGAVYTFGYIEHPSYNVRVKSTREDNFSVSIFVRRGRSLYDYADRYAAEVEREKNLPDIDANGITWTYRGLSSSKTEYEPYDERSLVTGPGIVYIYFDHDKKARNNAANYLTKGIAEARVILGTITNPVTQAAVQAAIDEANAVLNQTSPRKATTAELQAAYDKLREKLLELLGGSSPNRGGGGGAGGSSGGGSMTVNSGKSIRVGTDGSWQLVDAQRHIWNFNLTSGGKIVGWARLSYTFEGLTKTKWYNFNSDGVMNSGWILDAGKWYHLSTAHNGFFGEMLEGWFFDNTDGKWYYLDGSGAMVVGWQNIGGKWYYFTVNKDNKHPYGSLYVNTTTPDGYKVNADGVWIQ